VACVVGSAPWRPALRRSHSRTHQNLRHLRRRRHVRSSRPEGPQISLLTQRGFGRGHLIFPLRGRGHPMRVSPGAGPPRGSVRGVKSYPHARMRLTRHDARGMCGIRSRVAPRGDMHRMAREGAYAPHAREGHDGIARDRGSPSCGCRHTYSNGRGAGGQGVGWRL